MSEQIHAVGRRKEAVCRLYMTPGSGKWDVNGRTLGDYFPRPTLVSAIQQPFSATDTLGRYDVKAILEGGGVSGQAGALRLAVARALVKKVLSQGSAEISTKENQTFIFLLSLAFLHRMFVAGEARPAVRHVKMNLADWRSAPVARPHVSQGSFISVT